MRWIQLPIYNKLVRDRIPEIIEKSGKGYLTALLTDDEFVQVLKEKLKEETTELIEAQSNQEVTEEAADVLELLHAIAKVNGVSMEEIEKIRQEKKKQSGGFDDRIFLTEVE